MFKCTFMYDRFSELINYNIRTRIYNERKSEMTLRIFETL